MANVHFHNTFPQSVFLLFPALTPPRPCLSAKVKWKKTLNRHLSAETSPNNNSYDGNAATAVSFRPIRGPSTGSIYHPSCIIYQQAYSPVSVLFSSTGVQ